MKQFIDKLISRLEEERQSYYEDYHLFKCERDLGNADGFKRSVKIINELAEEYNNGWIPCSERLPEENIEVDVTVREIGGSTYTQTSWLQEGQWVVKKSIVDELETIRNKAIDDAIQTVANEICAGCGCLDGHTCTYKGHNCHVSQAMLGKVVRVLEQMKGGAV